MNVVIFVCLCANAKIVLRKCKTWKHLLAVKLKRQSQSLLLIFLIVLFVKKTLKEKLYDYKDSYVLLVGNDLSTGFSDEVIEQILKVCDVVNTAKDIMDKVDPLGGETGSLCVIFNPATEKYMAGLTFAKLSFYKE